MRVNGNGVNFSNDVGFNLKEAAYSESRETTGVVCDKGKVVLVVVVVEYIQCVGI